MVQVERNSNNMLMLGLGSVFQLDTTLLGFWRGRYISTGDSGDLWSVEAVQNSAKGD